MAKILVIGGAGYVGSSACAYLLDQGHVVHVLDDLSTGSIERLLTPNFTKARAGDAHIVRSLLRKENFDCVMHFAACALVGESVDNPQKYFENNVAQTQSLVESMCAENVRRIIFSSTCAVFGHPQTHRIAEDHPKNPLSPYGQSKLEAEGILASFAKSHNLQSVILRYFNAAGAEESLRTGEVHEPETHLIPNVFRAVLSGQPIKIFGNDYQTPDGTCIRDYVHVSDLAFAHSLALERLMKADPAAGFSDSFNIGSEAGHSVLEVVQMIEKVTGHKVKFQYVARRPGDAARLIGDSSKAHTVFGYKSKHDLESIVSSAWEWEKTYRQMSKAS